MDTEQQRQMLKRTQNSYGQIAQHASGGHELGNERAWFLEVARHDAFALSSGSATVPRMQEMHRPLLASKRCLRSNDLKNVRVAFATATGMVEPSCFTVLFVAPFWRSSYENSIE
jgi:hypothetical protein